MKTRVLKVLAAVLLVGGVLGFAGYRIYSRVSRPARFTATGNDPDFSRFATVRDMMQSGVHQEYTAISFTVWHDQPLTPAKLDSIAAAAARMVSLARELDALGGKGKLQGWNTPDREFFHQKSVQLYNVAQELNQAAQERDAHHIAALFDHLDHACQSCHQRFRPDLQWM